MQVCPLSQNSPRAYEIHEDEDLQLMTANLLKIKREITERDEDDNQMHKNISKSGNSSATRTLQLSQEIKQKYQQFLAITKLPSNHEQKLQFLLEQNMSIGICVALFEMLYYFREVVNEDVLIEVSQKAYKRLTKNKQKISPAQQCALLQLISLCGVYNEDVIEYVVQQLLQGRLDLTLSIVLLTNVGYKGFQLLVNLSRQDFKQAPMQILDHLSRTQEIMNQLLIPILVEDLTAAKGRQKDIILSILNRLNQAISSCEQLFPLLVQIFYHNPNDRGFIASVLRSSGPKGQKILMDLMYQSFTNQKIILPIISVLPWRAPQDPVLRVKVIEYSLGSNFMPGTLYQYEGNVEPSAFCFEEQDCCDSLCVNARDFIAALNRMLAAKLQNYQHEQNIRRGPLNNSKLFNLCEVIGKRDIQQIQISKQIIKVLNKCLSNTNPSVREAAINSLGLIGLPETFQSIQQITKCLWDKESKSRSMACWALSRICENPNKKIINRLVELLRDNFWKVRISACISIGTILKEPLESVMQALVRCLKDNSINKVTICQTIIKLGHIGQQILLQILKNTSHNDFKLREGILISLREADVKNPYIDFVLEEIFKNCKGTRAETRIICLETLNCLKLKASKENQNIVYLKAKNILPFYYYFLEDSSLKIRQMAMQSIFSFGGQAELIFIEGIAKGSQMVKIESAKGLARLGVQNFRALILGLRDQDPNVRKVTTDVLLSHFTPEDVTTYYESKSQQIPSLMCNLKDILAAGGLALNIKHFIKEIIVLFQKFYRQELNSNTSKLFEGIGSSYLYEDPRGNY